MTAGQPLSWVIGRGGLLGGAVSVALRGPEWVPPDPMPWHDDSGGREWLQLNLDRFAAVVRARNSPWQVLWCAGAGVVATPPAVLARETALFCEFVEQIGAAMTSRTLASNGIFFMASSAGGVYAGSPAEPPFDEQAPTGVLSAYGEAKLAQEAAARTLTTKHRVPVLIGRISNLFGPGQDTSKPQGLITQIGLGVLTRRPIQIYVSLDTIRDYLFSSDAGALVVRAMDRLRLEHAGEPATVTKILASGIDTTIASVLGAWRQVLKRPPGLVLAASPVRSLQPTQLSFRSRQWSDLDGATTPLTTGIHAVFQHQLESLRRGTLAGQPERVPNWTPAMQTRTSKS